MEENNIPSDVLSEVQVTKPKTKKSKKKSSTFKYTLESTMRTISLKFYDEQIINGIGSDDDKNSLKEYQNIFQYESEQTNSEDAKKTLLDGYNHQVEELADKLVPLFIDRIRSIDKSKMEIFGICHDLDTLTNDFFQPAIEKRHYHLIGFSISSVPYKLRSWLKAIGIVFTQDDTNIVKSIETVSHKCEMLNYLTHETEKAIKDGKYVYTDDKIFTNVNICTLNSYRNRDNNGTSSNISQEELVALDNRFYQLGYSAMSFDDSFHNLTPMYRKHSGLKSLLQDSYQKGLFDNIQQQPEIDRLCIYIEGASNTSKSYSAYNAAKALYSSVFVVDGGRTGSFDDYQVDTKCLIVNDYYLPNILNVCDNKKAKLYRRNSNSPYCLADVVIITGNKPFNVWLNDCNITDINQQKAMSTRFFVCQMEQVTDYYQARLIYKPLSIRGDYESKCWRFIHFIDKFNEIAKTYHPSKPPILSLELQTQLFRVSQSKAPLIIEPTTTKYII